MSLSETTILSSELETAGNQPDNDSSSSLPPFRKILLWAALLIAIVILGLAVFFVVKKYWFSPVNLNTDLEVASSTVVLISTTTPATLPDPNQPEIATTTPISQSFSNLAVEYLTFQGFYETPDNKITPKINDYKLPLNVKIDVMNYYDVSRKLNLDTSLDSLNNDGFATINNPWPQAAPDFYSAYNNLRGQQLPLLVTSDFIIYYYQNILKKAFKDVEENVFYDNLWDINKEMYQLAKTRYEARLAAIGDINDPVLEGERLETAFFAVGLELLKPTINQIAPKGAVNDNGLFAAEDTNQFYFVVPPYLRADVLAEVKLIRDANRQTKSPVLLYARNYTEFGVPSDYLANAKLNNFYLTTKWLNSIFPLNYRSKDCPDCLLDQSDWRINLTAASFISQDFSSLPELRGKWARIYKIMSYFKGLREDLSYVHYRDSLTSLFGADYKIEELFDEQNKQALDNLAKLRTKLLIYEFPEISGALAKTDQSLKSKLGFKMLAESYWPNVYIFSRLTTPTIGNYLGTSTKPYNNVTACLDKKTNLNFRCNGFALDAINLVYPIGRNSYFDENTNYVNYGSAAAKLQAELAKNAVWQVNNYWATLNVVKAYLTMDKNNLPLFAKSVAWQDRSLKTAAAAWINFQLPLEKFSVAPIVKGQNLDNFSRWNENSYVEPDLNLINELVANNNMLLKMFSALQLEADIRLALQDIRNFSSSLLSLKGIVIKELTGQKLEIADNEMISDFTKQLKISASPISGKQLYLKLPNQKTVLKEDLSRLKLLILIHQEDQNKVFSVGPVWDYQESQ